MPAPRASSRSESKRRFPKRLWAVVLPFAFLLAVAIAAGVQRREIDGTVVEVQRVARHSKYLPGVQFVVVIDTAEGRRSLVVPESVFRQVRAGDRLHRSAAGAISVVEASWTAGSNSRGAGSDPRR